MTRLYDASEFIFNDESTSAPFSGLMVAKKAICTIAGGFFVD
jgi:hypothetical protein